MNRSLSLPSAFALLRRAGDRGTVLRLIDRFPTEFEAIPLRGWKFALEAERSPNRRGDLYRAAADAFAADTPPGEGGPSPVPRAWSGENVHVWAKYFGACASLERISENRDETRTCIQEAVSALHDTWSGMVNEEVYRLHMAVSALGALVGLKERSAIDEALSQLRMASAIFGDAAWHKDMRRFLEDAKSALDEFEHDPDSSSVRLGPH